MVITLPEFSNMGSETFLRGLMTWQNMFRFSDFHIVFFYWTVSWNRKQKMCGQRSQHQPQIPPLKQNKQLIKNKPSKKNMSHPTSIPPPNKQHLSVLHVFRFMFTTNVNHKCWLYLFENLGSNHTNVISKPWHFRVLLNVCVCVFFLQWKWLQQEATGFQCP